MWMQQLWLAVIGLSAGAVVAGGVFSFIIGLGVVSDFADRTHTGEHIRLYEDAIALGGCPADESSAGRRQRESAASGSGQQTGR